MHMHPLRTLALILAGALVLGAVPALAQDDEEFPAPDSGAPLLGYTRSDGTIVLADGSFCRLLLGSLWGEEELTFVDLLDRTKNQRKARRAAIRPGSDEAIVARCVDVLAASRTEAPADDTLLAWVRRAPVVPEALAGLLREDFVAQPLAQPEAIGAAARTSGHGSLVSSPFSVTPGPWLAALDAADCEVWDGTLRDARDPQHAFPLQDNREYL